MKKIGLYSVTVLALAAILPLNAAAEEVSIGSNAYVEIEKNDGSEEGETPVNPIDPETPVDPAPEIDGEENPHPPSTKGPLSINYVSNLRFGKQKASGNDQTYLVKPDQVVETATNNQIEVPNYVQITDNRGTNAGWTLMVQQDGAFKNGEHELAGTELVFTNPVLSAKSGKEATAPVATKEITLSATNGASVVMSAENDHGMGTWANRFGEDNEQAKSSIQLKIPGESKKVAGFYQASLTWTLSDTPGK